LDIEELVGMVTKEVMSRIPSSTKSTAMDKKKVLVISSCEDELTMVKELVQDKYEVLNYNNEDVNLINYEHIIVTNLCNKGLASMALGLCNDKLQAFIVEALFNGKKIHVLKEGIQYRRYSTNANETLYNLYNQYECKIMSYGAIIVNQSDLLKSMEIGADCNEMHSEIVAQSETVVSENTVQSHQVVEINNKRLITESDLKKLYMNGIKEVNLINKAILTPLAQDFIRIKRLKINRV
jgi:ethanolamine utilization protein